MHEHGITNAVVHQIIHACEDSGMTNPRRIVVELGELTTYKKESVLFYFESIKKDYPILSDAELDIVEIPGKIFCNACGKGSDVRVASPIMFCPKCESSDVQVISGKDVVVKEITD